MAREIEGAWNQVAQKEYDDTSRVAFQYFGTQDIGGFAQWPCKLDPFSVCTTPQVSP